MNRAAAAAGSAERNQHRLIASLRDSTAFPHPVSELQIIETHISWVILTGRFAYKLKKSVRLAFLDFSTLALRRHYCHEELRLNRRWAPELYLEVVPIAGSFEHPEVGGDGPVIEYALKMMQFPQSAQLDRQLDAGLLQATDMRHLAETIAGYHTDAREIDFAGEDAAIRAVRSPMLDNFPPLEQNVDLELLQSLQDWTKRSLRDLRHALVARHKQGFVRECHGDLHLKNLVRLPSGIVAFDCVEFSEELRNIDVISDVAFLFMDLVGRARRDLAYLLLNRYLERSGDYAGMAVFDLYFVYHCLIRAKVAAIRGAERADRDGRRRDLEDLKHNLVVAGRWIERRRPALIAMHGYSGSGKTWLSERIMADLPAIRLRSDIERRRLFGLQGKASSRSEPGAGIYAGDARSGVYARLYEIAIGLLDAGHTVIIDASFLRRVDREQVVAIADKQQVPLVFVDTRAKRNVLDERLQRRAALGTDVSEADTDVLHYQFAHSDPMEAPERHRSIVVECDNSVDPDAVIKRLGRRLKMLAGTDAHEV